MSSTSRKKIPPSKSSPQSRYLLPILLLAGATAGFLTGGFFGHHWVVGDWPFFTGFLSLIGDVFMNLLKMLVVPFIVTSMILGMTSIKDSAATGSIFKKTFIYYFITTLLAVILGIVLVQTLEPGSRIDLANVVVQKTAEVQSLQWYDALFQTIRSLFPQNIFKAAVEGEILGLITFSLIFGFILNTLGSKGRQLTDLVETINDVLMIFVKGVIWFAPLGVFALVADKTGKAGGWDSVIQDLTALSYYFATVVAALAIHGIVVLPLLLFLFTGKNPLRHLQDFSEAVITAFSTASSAATLPITIDSAINNGGYSKQTARFVLPLGATVNMDGTALYEAIAVIFICQAYGIDLSLAKIMILALTATLAGVGAAAIPHAGLVTMVMVFGAVDVPPEIAQKGIATILAVDWILDRFRTSVNVWGDTIATAIVDKSLVKEDSDDLKN